MVTTILFALLKLQFMLMRKRPDVIAFTDPNGTDGSGRHSMLDENLMMAFSANNWFEGARTNENYI